MALTNQEEIQYDRQIRIWGHEAQIQLKQQKVLLINFDSFNSELAKNLVLLGISIDILDHSIIQQSDLSQNFYLTRQDIGKSPKSQYAANNLKLVNQYVNINSVEKINQNYGFIIISGNLNQGIHYSSYFNQQGIPTYFSISADKKHMVFSSKKIPLPEILQKIPSYIKTPRKKPKFSLYLFLVLIHSEFTSENPLTLLQPYPGLQQEFSTLTLYKNFYPSVMVTAGTVTTDIRNSILKGEQGFQVFYFDADSSEGLAVDLII